MEADLINVEIPSIQRRATRSIVVDSSDEGSSSNPKNIRENADAENTNRDSVAAIEDSEEPQYSLRKISKHSDSEVWKYFGVLYKNSTQVLKLNKRIFCRICFDSNPKQFKR